MQKLRLLLGGSLRLSHGEGCLAVMAGLLGTCALVRLSLGAEFTCAAGEVACLIAAINTANANREANTITLAVGDRSGGRIHAHHEGETVMDRAVLNATDTGTPVPLIPLGRYRVNHSRTLIDLMPIDLPE
jgi:hypothetical protein